MKHFQKSKWIWLDAIGSPDCYGEFYTTFNWKTGNTVCRICCDGDYTLYINGHYVSAWQYGDYEHYKVYDQIEITPFLTTGKNHIAVLVWHYGNNSQRYIRSQAGLLFEIVQDNRRLATSDSTVLCRQSPTFQSGNQKIITPQLGYSFSYNATKEDRWKLGIADGFVPATVVSKNCNLIPRPIAQIPMENPSESKCLLAEGGYYLFDLGKETVGIPVLSFESSSEQEITVLWGEDLQDGHVRRFINNGSNGEFSFQYIAKQGENSFTNYMLRMGCRYLEVFSERSIQIHYIGLLHATYPAKAVELKLSDTLDQAIYDICVDTLKLCLMDHYVDTPWREQGLYAFDSRNQMLCGYYAFSDKNAEYARANLLLMSQDRRPDGLLSITFPCGMDATIPSFSLYYIKAVREYITYTGDTRLGKEVFSKLQSILNVFVNHRRDGLVYSFDGHAYWNFYDWSPLMDGGLHIKNGSAPDLILNCLFIIAIKELQTIAVQINDETPAFEAIVQESVIATKAAFYRPDSGLFALTTNGNEYNVLGNALAILAGLTDENEAQFICRQFGKEALVEPSLSMKTFQYDAMLQTDSAYSQEILNEIRTVYGYMLACGATSVWETAKGASDFGNCGSLCHGWSAIPVYY